MAHDQNHVRHQDPEGTQRLPLGATVEPQADQTWQPQIMTEGCAQPHGPEYVSPEAVGQLGGHATRGTFAPQAEAALVQPDAVKGDEPTVATQPLTAARAVSRTGRLAISGGVGQLQHIMGGNVRPVLDPSGMAVELAAAGRVNRQGSWTFVDGKLLIRKGADGRKVALNANLEWVPAPGRWTRRKIQEAARNGALKTAVFAPGQAPVPVSGERQAGLTAATTLLRRLIPVGRPGAGDETKESLRPDAVRLDYTVVEPSFEATQVTGRSKGGAATLGRLRRLLGGEVSRGSRPKPPPKDVLAREMYGHPIGDLTNAQQLQVEMRLGRLRRGLDRPDGDSAGAA